ncbi:sugar transferase [Flavobacterium sp. F372]|uniref:Exopolysaccharide biosynthesis polyprenyl glycosylphosphotransferase n=1 Tax=Flavobacterium bernardetii TaxID=2813823 RepID=A0ABR7IUA1_9FLAO|nr:exopolysaccharide biosynthesis polyprenyl glycosylphosphotransferase [Flavobacterium bernardetii]MBC5833346.1 exopolysaccharide biosynthesis polyprenyl glycosylphosphotransferase [Flavobacterium bernardetii]NHF68578.1 sugar transferase [Flavobacterium bernardetii]
MTKPYKKHFEISERKILLRIFDIFFVVMFLFLINTFTDLRYFAELCENYYWIAVLGLYLTLLGTVFEMYNLVIVSFANKITKGLLLTSFFTTLFFIFTPIVTPSFPKKRIELFLLFLVVLLALTIWRLLYIYLLASKRFYKPIVLVCRSKDFNKLSKELIINDPHIRIVKFIDVDFNNQNSLLSEFQLNLIEINGFLATHFISEIVVAKYSKKTSIEVYNKLLEISENGIPITQYEDVYEDLTSRIPLHLKDKSLYKFFPFSKKQNQLYLLLVRCIDIVVSIIGLTVLVAIIPFIFFFNLIWNKGPLLFHQERIGRKEVPFKIFKLRTMIVNAEKNGAVFATLNDSRITPFGKLLRKTRIDEFPQFINVLKGEMSIIGPRPERKVFVDQIANEIPLYHTRHIVKPGLTGWAQINYPYGETLEDSLMKLEYDLYYIKHRNIFLDINIAVKTFGTILYMKGQ